MTARLFEAAARTASRPRLAAATIAKRRPNSRHRPITAEHAMLPALLFSVGCVGSISNRDAQHGNATLREQLIDQQKAKEAGAISEADYEIQKSRLLGNK